MERQVPSRAWIAVRQRVRVEQSSCLLLSVAAVRRDTRDTEGTDR